MAIAEDMLQSKKGFFQKQLEASGYRLKRSALKVLQVNLGQYCNMTCFHCHVEAGPTKIRENMNKNTASQVLQVMKRLNVEVLDLTGGAPELNVNFRRMVVAARQQGRTVMDRCNLTVFFEEGQSDLPDFLASNQVVVVASLPCYLEDNVDQQRGSGTFKRSVESLRWLNRLGYGRDGSNLVLNLVYNPVGAHLPPSQSELESQYKLKLRERFGIVFNQLFTICNMPITRYASFLKATGAYDEYMKLLVQSFNINTAERLMCRDTLSISWDGKIYDCDFNQALKMPLVTREPIELSNLSEALLEKNPIVVGDHCFGCTAGSGSSCQGAVTTS